MIRVTLIRRKSRAKNNPGVATLYLKYTPHIFNPVTLKSIERESLGYDVYLKPKNAIERMHNKAILERANAIKCQRQIDVVNQEFGFLNKTAQKGDFLLFFKQSCMRKDSKAMAAYKHFERFINGRCRFCDLSTMVCERFREHLLKSAKGPHGESLSNNTAAAYFSVFRLILKEAYRYKFLRENLNEFLDKIQTQQTFKPYLTMNEVKALNATPCHIPVLKSASMFSILTGLRISDIISLEWEHISTAPDGGPCIIKTIEKSSREEIVYISHEALELCGERGSGIVFSGLTKSMTRSHLKRWVQEAGITKKISFHTFRHTNATLLIEKGNDIYTVSKMLTHKNVGTTQIYADVVDSKKRAAADSLTLK